MARQRDNVKALAKFSIEELEGEVVRRKNQASKWGYIIISTGRERGDDADYDDKRARVGIVTVEQWNKEGCLDDSHLSEDDVTMPPGFDQTQESIFMYLKGDLKKAEEVLQKSGFVKLREGNGR